MYEDLMEIAETLARMGVGKPRQAYLRRAVSTAYYAVFHFAIEEACRDAVGSHHSQRPYRDALARAFVHTTMKLACNSFGGGNLKASIAKGLPQNAAGQYVIPTAIKDFAGAFVELQTKRHLADYDRSEAFRRGDVVNLIEESKQAVEQFQTLPESPDRKFFLACLWAWKELSAR